MVTTMLDCHGETETRSMQGTLVNCTFMFLQGT